MMSMSEKLRCFFVRSARDVASQALPNWAQISVSLAENFYEVFIACPDEDQQALLEGAGSELERVGFDPRTGRLRTRRALR